MTSERKKLLITGASGFICANFIRNALYGTNRCWDIIGVDKISSQSALNSIYINKDYNNYIADITDEHIFSRIVEYERPDIIIHAAALTSVDEALQTPNEYVHNNVIGTQVVVKTAVKFKVDKFIYISTDEIYGHLTSENDKSWTEDAPVSPRNLYAGTKASGEHIVSSYGHSHNLNFNTVRMSNNYGKRQTINKLIPRAIKSLFAGEKIKIYGKGEQIRDWMHTDDSYSGICAVIEKGVSKETYNIGANQEFSNIEVAQLICNHMKLDLQVEFVADRPAHDFRYSLCSDKLKKLGWEPQVKFKDGIRDTIEWFKRNPYWLK